MKVPSSLVGILAIAGFFSDCTKKEDAAPQSCRIISASLSNDGQTTTTTFNYNAGGQIISSQSVMDAASWTTTYTYDSEGRLTIQDASFGYIEFYSYSTSNQLIRDSLYVSNVGNPLWIVKTYTYNANGQLITHVEKTGFSACTTCGEVMTVEYTYPNNTTKNYSSTVTTMDTSPSYTSTYEYDSRLIRYNGTPVPTYFTDNYAKKIIHNISPSPSEVNLDYVFNASGYPTSITMTLTNPAATIIQSMAYTCN